MVHVLEDRVRETSTTTGTGSFALAGAVTRFRTFASVMADADTTLYLIRHQSANEWEVGVGTYETTGNLLLRTTILKSSNAGAAVNFSSGTKDVLMVLTTSGEWPILRLVEGGSISWDAADIVLIQSGNVLELTGGDLDLSGSVWITGSLLGSGGTGAPVAPNGIDFADSGPLVGVAGSASVPPIEIASTTLLTTPAAGAIERDATNLYGTTDAGNRGIIPIRHHARLAADLTLASNTNEQSIFGSGNDVLTLETGVYLFELLIRVTSMSATSGNARIDFVGAGSATTDTWLWYYSAVDNSSPSPGPVTGQMGWPAQVDSAASIATAGTGTAMGVYARGSFDVTTAGTINPVIDLVTASAAVITAGSFFTCERIGASDSVAVGQWA